MVEKGKTFGGERRTFMGLTEFGTYTIKGSHLAGAEKKTGRRGKKKN